MRDLAARVGRNDPCPCGSGRKFKLCCLNRSRPGTRAVSGRPAAIVGIHGDGSSRYRFQAGSYGVRGGFLPSIACLRCEAAGDWGYHFVLVVPDSVSEDEEAAFLQAGDNLSAAFRGDSSPEALAHRLNDMGYVSVSGFRVIADDSTSENGFVPAMGPNE